jgi:hypothetical protein
VRAPRGRDRGAVVGLSEIPVGLPTGFSQRTVAGMVVCALALALARTRNHSSGQLWPGAGFKYNIQNFNNEETFSSKRWNPLPSRGGLITEAEMRNRKRSNEGHRVAQSPRH